MEAIWRYLEQRDFWIAASAGIVVNIAAALLKPERDCCGEGEGRQSPTLHKPFGRGWRWSLGRRLFLFRNYKLNIAGLTGLYI
jgi:hypothetical protein